MLSVYSRRYSPCPSDDINYKRCRCPKSINSVLGSDGPSSVATPRLAVGKRLRISNAKLEQECEAKQQGLEESSRPKPALVTIKEAVSGFLNSRRRRRQARRIDGNATRGRQRCRDLPAATPGTARYRHISG